MDKKKVKPMYKPKKELSVLQKRLMKEHKKHHTKKLVERIRSKMFDCVQKMTPKHVSKK